MLARGGAKSRIKPRTGREGDKRSLQFHADILNLPSKEVHEKEKMLCGSTCTEEKKGTRTGELRASMDSDTAERLERGKRGHSIY